MAEVEAEAFGDLDRPDLYFQFYPDMYGSRRGSMVPFAFRLLLAELPQYLSKHHDALDRLYALLAIVRKVGTMSSMPTICRAFYTSLLLRIGRNGFIFKKLYNFIVSQIIANLERGRGEDGTAINLGDNERGLSLELWRSREVRIIYSLVSLRDVNPC